MAEVVGIVAGIGAILKTLTSTGIFAQNVGSASGEAQEVVRQVHATEAILKSLQASLEVLRQPQEFHDIWVESTKPVMGNVKITVEQLNEKLSSNGGKARLSLWRKAKWPLQKEETVVLQQHMQAYIQMLSMIQNAAIQ
jgi:hypothetical protein